MAYVDGFVIAVPTASKDKFLEHARLFDQVLIEQGALRILECWGDDVPPGKQTDFLRAVEAKQDETVAFSWIEWPDKETRDSVHARMEDVMKSDPRLKDFGAMPFDGKRMIFGGFVPILTLEA